MLTSTHAHVTWTVTAGRPHRGWRVLGAVLPDLPGWVLGAWLRAGGARGRELIDRLYHRQPQRAVHEIGHSGPAVAALLATSPPGSRRRALAAGWAGHLAVDAVTHHSDAWPLGWPLTRRTWASPLSYWERDHHATAYFAAELAYLAATARRAPAIALLAAGCSLASRRTWPPGG